MVEHKTITISLHDLSNKQFVHHPWNIGGNDTWRCLYALPFADSVIFVLERFV